MEQRFMIDDLRDHNEKLKLQNEILKAEIEKQKIFHDAETCKFEQRISDLKAEVQHLNEQLTESKLRIPWYVIMNLNISESSYRGRL